MTLELLQWREPLWLWLLLQPLLLLGTVWWLRRRSYSDYADTALLPWTRAPRFRLLRSVWWRALGYTLAWSALVIALAGPRVPERIITTDPQAAPEVMLLIDLSRSMSANDISPSRLERAKLKLTQLIQSSSNVRYGITVFAGRTHVLCPPTLDKQVLLTYLANLHTRMLPTEGSQLDEAITFSAMQAANQKKPAAIILVTDGDLSGISPIAKSGNTALYIYGFGTRSGAALADPVTGWLTYDGQPVISQSNFAALESLAARHQGRVILASDDDTDWQTVYQLLLRPLSSTSRDNPSAPLIIWQELYHYFLFSGVVLLLLAHLQYRASPAVPLRITNATPLLVLVVCLCLIPVPGHTAMANYRDAYAAAKHGDYLQAQKLYATIPDYAGRMGEGHAFYQLKNYTHAAAQFTQAVLIADQDDQRAQALFNLANSYYKLADYSRASAIYRDVLRYQPDFTAASVNLEYANTLIKQAQVQKPDKQTAQRSGRGPRTALAPENMPITQGRVTLDDSPTTITLPPVGTVVPDVPATQNLDNAAPAASGVESRDDVTWTYDSTVIDAVMLQSFRYQQDDSRLWKRLFEWEENFPAPVVEPHAIPGVRPW